MDKNPLTKKKKKESNNYTQITGVPQKGKQTIFCGNAFTTVFPKFRLYVYKTVFIPCHCKCLLFNMECSLCIYKNEKRNWEGIQKIWSENETWKENQATLREQKIRCEFSCENSIVPHE